MTLVDISDDRLDDTWHNNAKADSRTRESSFDTSYLVPSTEHRAQSTTILKPITCTANPAGSTYLLMRVSRADAEELKKKLTAKGSIAIPAWSGVLCSPACRCGDRQERR